MKVFFQSIVAQLLLNPYLFWRGYQAIPAKKSWRIPYVAFFIVELLLFFLGFFFHKELPDGLLLFILHCCNTWYVASLYLAMALLLLELIRLSDRFFPWYPARIRLNRKKVKQTLLLVILFGVGGLMVHAYYTVMHPRVTHVSITLPKGSSSRERMTVVLMSDLHIGEVIRKKMVQKYVSLSNAQHPDLVVLAGDILDYESRYAEQDRIEDDLQQLKAPLGVYAIYGNHEYRANRHAKHRWLQQTGATLLIDSVAMPDSSFYLIGRDDRVNKKRQALSSLMRGLDRTKPVIVLDHQPYSFAEMAMNGVDLGLHGHTHNGQLWPYPLLMRLVYDCPYGYDKKGPTQFYVSSGIGVAGPPFRVATYSELVVLHLTFSDTEPYPPAQ